MEFSTSEPESAVFPDDLQGSDGLAFRDPTRAEVVASASPTYVEYLVHLLDQRAPFDAKVLSRLDTLAAERDRRATQLVQSQAQAEALRSLQEAVAEKTLELQEARERCLRLQHENTVLHMQESTQRERVAALAELCRQRGLDGAPQASHSNGAAAARGARPATRATNSAEGPETFPTRASASGSPVDIPLPKSFSLRAATAQAQAQRSADVSTCSATVRTGEVGAACRAGDLSVSSDVALARAVGLQGDGHGAASAAHVLALTEEVQMLREQLDTQRSLYEHERGHRIREYESEHRQTVEQTRDLLRTIQHLEELHEVCLRDLVQYRHHAEKELRDYHGQVDWLKQHMQEALLLAERKTRRSAGAAVASEQRVLQKVNPMVLNLRHEQTKLKAQLQEERQNHAAQLSEADNALQDAKSALAQEKQRRRREESRHRLEMEGVRSELDLMRHALRQMEKRVYFTGSRLDVAATEEQNLTEDYYY